MGIFFAGCALGACFFGLAMLIGQSIEMNLHGHQFAWRTLRRRIGGDDILAFSLFAMPLFGALFAHIIN